MSFEKIVEQSNVLDGSIYAIVTHPEGAYVTIAGRGDRVHIIAFDLEDLQYLSAIYRELTSVPTNPTPPAPADPDFSPPIGGSQ